MDSNSESELGLLSRRKRPFIQEGKEENEVGALVDRISDLPDHIIAQVLSFLETDEAVRTSILSSRWRYLWKGISRISLHRYNNIGAKQFSNLLEHVLKDCNSSNLLAFDLSCPRAIDMSRLNGWVSSIKSHKIEKLMICAGNSDHFVLPEAPLPQCILSYSTLVSLKLDCFDIQVPESVVKFPHLKSLDLHVVFPNSEAAVNRLLSCSPVLENLNLVGFLDITAQFCKLLRIDISVSTLRKLKLRLVNAGSSYRKKKGIIIDAPNLEYLSIVDDSLARYLVKNLSSISNVFVDYDVAIFGVLKHAHINHLLQLFKGIVATKLLTVHWNTADVLGSAISYTWPTFPYLKTLILHFGVFKEWTCFSKLLHSTPSLEILVLNLEWINDDVDERPLGDDDLSCWNPPESVPNCLLEHLKLIGIQYFVGHKDELQVVKYLLNNAQELECMMIGYDPDYLKEEVVGKLRTFPRASKACDVQIYEHIGFDTDLINEVTIWGI